MTIGATLAPCGAVEARATPRWAAQSHPRREPRAGGLRLRSLCRPWKRTGTLWLYVPAPRLAACICGDLLGLQIVLEAPAAEFAADAGLLVAAPWRFGVGRLGALDPHDAGPQGGGDALRARLVGRHHGGGEDVAGIVGELRRLLLGGEGAHAYDRPENLLAPGRAVQRHIGEDRRLHIISPVEARRAFAPARDGGAGRFGRRDGGCDLIVLAARNQRAEQHAFIQPVADADAPRFLHETRHQRVMDAFLHQNPRGRRAHLPLIPEDAEHDPFDRLPDVGIVEDDEWRL